MKHIPTALVALALTAVPITSHPATIRPGDIVVGNPVGSTRVLVINGADGSYRGFSHSVSYPTGVAFDEAGSLFVSDLNGNAIVELDTETGLSLRSIPAPSPLGLGILDNGNFVIINQDLSQVVMIDRNSGAQTFIASGGLIQSPVRLAVGPDQSIYITTYFYNSPRIVRVDAQTREQTIVAPLLATGIAVAPNGDVLLPHGSGLIVIDAESGVSTVLSPAGPSGGFGGIAIGPNGNYFVTAHRAGRPEIVEIDALTGDQSVFAVLGEREFPIDLAVAFVPEPTVVLLMMAIAVIIGLYRYRPTIRLTHNPRVRCSAKRLLLAAMMVLPLDAARGATVTLSFTGIVQSRHDDFGALPNVSVGSIVSGSLTYDNSAPDLNPETPDIGGYAFAAPGVDVRPGTLMVDVGAVHFEFDYTPPDCDTSVGCSSDIRIQLASSPVGDSWFYQVLRSYQYQEPLLDYFTLVLVGDQMLASDALVVPDLRLATSEATIRYTARDDRLQSIGPGYSEFFARVASLSATVPEPGSARLALAVLLFLAMRRRSATG